MNGLSDTDLERLLQVRPAPRPPAQLGALIKAEIPSHIAIGVEDIHAMAKKVTEHGGFIVDPPFDTGGGEWICLFNEPSGVTFAMIQEIPPAA